MIYKICVESQVIIEVDAATEADALQTAKNSIENCDILPVKLSVVTEVQ